MAEATRQEQQRQARAVVEQYKRVQSKEAWKKSLKFIDVRFEQWLETRSKPEKNSYISVEWAWVKSFDLADVQWNDDRHVLVNGILAASPKGGKEHLFSWTRRLEFKDDGVDKWWQADEPVFADSTLTSDQTAHIMTQTIVMPDKGWRVVVSTSRGQMMPKGSVYQIPLYPLDRSGIL